MWIILAFWLLLPVPGFAWLSRFDPESLTGGWLSVVARSYLASLVMLSPVSVLGYVMHWPVTVLSIAYLCLVAAGLWRLVRLRHQLRMPRVRESSLIAALGCGWLAFDLWLGARVGSHMQGDAGFHVARIRMLREIGLGSWDPLVDGLQFEPVYHTNLYHALIAASAQLARVDPGAAWVWVWPFAKLLVAAASYELALQVLGERRLAWVAALTAGAWFTTQAVLPYPNTLAPFAFLALGLAMTVAALSGSPSFRNAAWLGAAGAAIAQTHMLYASFLVLIALPALLLRFGYAVARRQRGRAELLAALLFLAAPLPWLAVPALPRIEAWLTSVAHAQPPPAAANAPSAKERKAGLFVDVGEGAVRMNPRDFLGPTAPLGYLLAALALFAALARRAAVLALLALLATVGVYLFVPPVCTALITLLTARWIVVRFVSVFDIACIALLPATALGVLGLLALLISRRTGAGTLPGWANGALQLLGCAAAFYYVQLEAPRGEPWTVATTWQAAKQNQARASAERVSERAAFFAKHVAPGASVMAPLLLDYYLPMHCNCRGLAFRGGRGGRDVADIAARRTAADRFYAHDTPDTERAELAARYRLNYVYSSPRRAPRLAAALAPRVVSTAISGGDAIITLRSSPP